MSGRRAATVRGVGAILVVAALVAGCGSTSPLASPTTTAPPTTTTTVAATTTTVPKPKPTPPSKSHEETRRPVPAAVYAGLSTIPPAALAAAAHSLAAAGASPTPIHGPALTSGGKPTVLSIGAEWCPYCAAENWALVVALSQFGTFKGLAWVASSPKPTELYRSVPGFTFYRSTYASSELTFDAVETASVSEQPLAHPTAAAERLSRRYDRAGAIPFLYLDGIAYLEGSGVSPALLIRHPFARNARGVIRGKSALALSVEGNAGVIVSYLCQLTHGQPGRVCAAFPKVLTG